MYGIWMWFLVFASGQVFTAGQSDKISKGSRRKCVLPATPKNGWFSYTHPGRWSDGPNEVNLTIICKPPHRADRPAKVYCHNGKWSAAFAKCKRCHFTLGPSELLTTCPDGCMIVIRASVSPVALGQKLDHHRCAALRRRECVIPALPKNGWLAYTPPDNEGIAEVNLTIICKPPYRVDRPALVHCYDGKWSAPFAKCKLSCKLSPHPSVTYSCIATDPSISDEERDCTEDEPSGTEVIPKCNDNYYSSEVLRNMYCNKDGTWDYVAVCQPAPNATSQSTTTSRTVSSQAGPGESEIPNSKPDASSTVSTEENSDEIKSLWHVAIYERKADQFDHICGGTLISEDVVISAAHCFLSPEWKELPPTQFKVAAGKVYSQYDDPRDTHAQYSDIKNIITTKMTEPCRQPDMAAVSLMTPVSYNRFVRPVCINYDRHIQNEHLVEGNPGVVASFAVQIGDECKPSANLNWLSLPFAKESTCQSNMSSNTTGRNRLCAGYINNATHCDIDSGNGLVFYSDKIPYLRAITTNVIDNPECTKFLTRSFSEIITNAENFEKPFGNLVRTNLVQCKLIYTKEDQDLETVTEFIPTEPIEDDGHLYETIGKQPDTVPKILGSNAPIYQWHVGVYSKTSTPYKQICGGSLVKRDFVISAAYCFWDEEKGEQQRASQYAVAVGKVYRPWNITLDTSAQQSDVSQIILPVHYRGAITNYQNDIAIVRLRTPFEYIPGARPVCVNFEDDFVKEQLQEGYDGTVCGWGLSGSNGFQSQVLSYLELPYMDLKDCFEQFQSYNPSFLKYITSDKICAGFQYIAKALCRGDSGGGYVIYSGTTPYLHGVISTAASNEHLCDVYTIGALTSTYSHRTFIRNNIPDIENECGRLSPFVTTEGNEMTGNAGGNVGAGNGNSDVLTGNAATGIGNSGVKRQADVVPAVVGTGSSWNVMEERVTENAAEGSTPAMPLPYNPHQFFCNCNC